MAERHTKHRCPNCGAQNKSDAQVCAICDTPLKSTRYGGRPRFSSPTIDQRLDYDPGEGEDDLMVSGLWGTPLAAAIGLLLCAGISIGLAGLVYYLMEEDEPVTSQAIVSETPNPLTQTATRIVPSPLPTNTRPALPLLPTVTSLPPSATPTPTEGPCIQTARSGDTVYGMALRCGHQHLAVVPLIVEMNIGLESEQALQEGQVLEIPWPTPTEGPLATESGDEGSADEASGSNVPNESSAVNDGDQAPIEVAVNEFGTPDNLATLFVEPTLRPGLAWHTVSENETLINLISVYNADAKVISDLNPEIEFRQCDFRTKFGGENCSVILVPGQRVRVPAPTPTATIPPTPSGSETPTLTATPTFNVPQAFAPTENEQFGAQQLVTLRWTVTGTLASNEVYLVSVRNLDNDRTFQARTEELFFVLPETWQANEDRSFEYEWTVSIATIDGDQVIATRQQTPPRRFQWQGLP
jgi:hypothetical protein